MREQFSLPFADLSRVDTKFLGDFVHGLDAADRFNRNFRLVLTGEQAMSERKGSLSAEDLEHPSYLVQEVG